jgi:hypothetical protein
VLNSAHCPHMDTPNLRVRLRRRRVSVRANFLGALVLKGEPIVLVSRPTILRRGKFAMGEAGANELHGRKAAESWLASFLQETPISR